MGQMLAVLALGLGLGACAASGGPGPTLTAPVVTSGPQADFPALVGPAYDIGGTTYTPVEVLNYDEVGYLAVDEGAMGYTGAHHTLPVPSYAEVTSLETGRTVLVRLERRGPMDSHHLAALSPAALAQLGAGPETPIRLRRVNPPEEQRAMLRGGDAAPLRMDTPMSLVTVLRRRLPQPIEVAPEMLVSAAPEPAQIAVIDPSAIDPEPEAIPAPLAQPPAQPVAPEVPASVTAEGGFVVQAAAFSNAENARRAANVLRGTVSQSGAFYRVRTGPFATRGEAEASLAIIRRAGYSDARILTSG